MATFGQVPQDPAAGAEFLATLARVDGRVTFHNIPAPQKQEGLKKDDRPWQYYEIKGGSEVGAPLAVLVVAEVPHETVTVMLPDGRVVMQLWKTSGYYGPNVGLAADGRDVQFGTNLGKGLSALTFKHVLSYCNKPFLEIPGPKESPWVWLFMILTCCLKACCVNCIWPPPKFSVVFKGTAEVGRIVGAGKGMGPSADYLAQAQAQDPAVLSGMILMMSQRIWGSNFNRCTA